MGSSEPWEGGEAGLEVYGDLDFAEPKSPRDNFAMKGEDSADRGAVGEIAGGDMLCAGAKLGRDVVSTLILDKR